MLYNHVRANVLVRDNYKCYHCESIKHLTIHHIKPQRKFKELIYNEENCVTLCIRCHRLIEQNKLTLDYDKLKEYYKVDPIFAELELPKSS